MPHRLHKAVVIVAILLFLSACASKEHGGIPSDVLASGEIVYKQYCLTCHLATGAGAAPMNPPLINTSFVIGDEKVLIGIVLNGMSNTLVDGERYRNVMPPFTQLTDKEVADVLTYVRNSFGNKGPLIAESTVAEVRQLK